MSDMTDDIAQLQRQLEKAAKDLREAEDREFCKPEHVRAALINICKALGGITGAESMGLAELAEEIRKDAKATNSAFQRSLWPDSRGC